MTPEFLRLKQEWDRRLGKELNLIDKTIQRTGWTFTAGSKTGGLRVVPLGELGQNDLTIAGSDKYLAVEAVRVAARKLPYDYPRRELIMAWAFGESRNSAGVNTIARNAGIGRRRLRSAVTKFLRTHGLANPWSKGPPVKKDDDICHRKGCGTLGAHSPHGDARQLTKAEVKALSRG